MTPPVPDLLQWSLSEAGEAIRKKEISPVELTQATIACIENKNTELNAYITVMAEQAADQAKQAQEEIAKGNYRGPLHGIPIGLKDLIFTRGVRTTSASEVYQDFIPDYDAEVVTRLRQAGAVIVGKLNMQQHALGASGDVSYYGPARNPHDPTRVAGGSSSGSGVAVAGYMAYGSIGSDTAGSIRVPASFCGIVGMKPTFGLVSKRGSFTLSWTADHLGPMTRTVRDNALMLNAIAGFDPQDPYSVEHAPEDYTAEIGKAVKGLKVGIPDSYFFDILEPEVRKVFDQSIERLKAQGAEFRSVRLAHMDELAAAQQTVALAEVYAAFEHVLREQPEKMDVEIRTRMTQGLFIGSADYIRALRIRHEAVRQFTEVLSEVDVIMTPTVAILPEEIGQKQVEVGGNRYPTAILIRLTGPITMLGLPAMSVPGGKASNGLPVGIQLIGRPFAEKTLYRLAHGLE